jgi:DNA-binding MarR family transcriptional regulator
VLPAPEAPIPWLLRAARECYGQAIRRRLAAAGLEPLPGSGMHVVGGMAAHRASASAIVHELRISKQAASQLIDTLVARGCVERRPDPADRRRVSIELTDRGREYAAAIIAAVAEVEAELARRLPPDGLDSLRRGLAALGEIGKRAEETR